MNLSCYIDKDLSFNIAGNMWEWTDEQCYVNNTESVLKILRGGTFHSNYTDFPVCYRAYNYVTCTHTLYGFRPVLYIK